MDIKVNVTNQKLEIEKDQRNYISGTQEFIRFKFNMDSNWDNLKVFAQFTQNGKSYNQYLDDNRAAYLPTEIKAGVCTLVLCGTGGKTIATTSYLRLTIDKNILVTDAQSTEITESLYQQLVNKIDEYFKEAPETLSELEVATKTASTAKSELETSVSTVNETKASIDSAITNVNTAKSELNATIENSNTAKSNLETIINNSDTVKTDLNTTITNAEIAKENLETSTSENITKIEAAGQEQIDKITEAGGSSGGGGSCDCNNIETALSNYFLLHRNGKVFTTKIYKYNVSTSSTGVKMNANEGMVAEPSVGKVAGRDDYQQYGLFQHFTCNWHVDENGFNHIDAIEGQTGFTKYGKVQVGEVTCGAWFGVEDTTDAVLYHYSDSQTELTPQPMKECINPDGTISPWMIHAKYIAGDIDGKPYSSKGLAPASYANDDETHRKFTSYSSMIDYMHQHGNHYCGTTCWDLFYRQLMMIIKYGTINSQSVMAGCVLSTGKNVGGELSGIPGVLLTENDASQFTVGSYVSVGDVMSSSSGSSDYITYKIYNKKITEMDNLGNGTVGVVIDNGQNLIDVTSNTRIVSMPWISGQTDEVIGSDGSPTSNTNGKEPFKIQGIETMVGCYEVLGNTVVNFCDSGDGEPSKYAFVCENASILSTDSSYIYENYKGAFYGTEMGVSFASALGTEEDGYSGSYGYISSEDVDTNLGIMIPTSIGAGSSTCFADELVLTSEEELLSWFTSFNGLWSLSLGGISESRYDLYISATTVSPNGTRGNWQTTT